MRNQLAEQGFTRMGGRLYGARSGLRSIVPRMNPLFHSILHGVNPLLLTERTTPGTSGLPPFMRSVRIHCSELRSASLRNPDFQSRAASRPRGSVPNARRVHGWAAGLAG